MDDHAQFIIRDGSFSFICDSIICLHHYCGLVITSFGKVHISVRCLILPLFYSICSNAVQHTLYNVTLLYCSVANIGYADVMWCIIS